MSKIAALYFSMCVMTTVSLGDIIPKSDLARFAVILQVLYGLTVFTLIGAALANVLLEPAGHSSASSAATSGDAHENSHLTQAAPIDAPDVADYQVIGQVAESGKEAAEVGVYRPAAKICAAAATGSSDCVPELSTHVARARPTEIPVDPAGADTAEATGMPAPIQPREQKAK
jgi:hypothetical protein